VSLAKERIAWAEARTWGRRADDWVGAAMDSARPSPEWVTLRDQQGGRDRPAAMT